MTIYNVPADGSLSSVLGSATGGDTIILADGSYGAFNFTQTFASDVTIIAANALGAVFGEVRFTNASHIVFDGMRVNAGGHTHMFTLGTASYITVKNCEIGENSGFGGAEAYYGVNNSGTTSNLTFDSNYVHSVQNGFAILEYTSNLTITNNIIDYFPADAMKFAGITTGLIENNFIGPPGVGYHVPTYSANPGAHPDIMQLQTVVCTNLTIRGNVALPAAGGSSRIEGIFGGASESLIEQNVFACNAPEAIDVLDDNVVQYNTLVYVNDPEATNYYHNDIIFAGTGNTSNYNVYTQLPANSGPLGTNMRIQTTSSGSSYFDEDQFVNFTGQLGVQIEDLLPAEGADIGTLGAYDRILELAGLTTPTKPALAGGQVLLINGLPLLGS